MEYAAAAAASFGPPPPLLPLIHAGFARAFNHLVYPASTRPIVAQSSSSSSAHMQMDVGLVGAIKHVATMVAMLHDDGDETRSISSSSVLARGLVLTGHSLGGAFAILAGDAELVSDDDAACGGAAATSAAAYCFATCYHSAAHVSTHLKHSNRVRVTNTLPLYLSTAPFPLFVATFGQPHVCNAAAAGDFHD
jgi:hypothetical protein